LVKKRFKKEFIFISAPIAAVIINIIGDMVIMANCFRLIAFAPFFHQPIAQKRAAMHERPMLRQGSG